jgi:hypothetical protein
MQCRRVAKIRPVAGRAESKGKMGAVDFFVFFLKSAEKQATITQVSATVALKYESTMGILNLG